MSRYSHVILCSTELAEVRRQLNQMISDKNFSLVYDSSDYWVAREKPGRVSISELVTLEVFFDNVQEGKLRLSCIVKNEALPLQTINHCQQLFEVFREELDGLEKNLVAVGEGHRLD